MVNVRLTGVTTPTDGIAAAEAGYSMVGLVFDPDSRRCLSAAAGAAIAQILGDKVTVVAGVKDGGDEMLFDIVRTVKPQILELQGDESPQRAQMIKHKTGCTLMKTLKIYNELDIANAQAYAAVVDWIVFDVRPNKPANENQAQGLTQDMAGQRFDWSLFKTVRLPIPWILSGGLDLDNVQTILHHSGADYINVCSGVEPSPGRKDIALINEFMQLAKTA